jgi:uncharacterized protein (UPF0303 family)
MKKTAPPVGEDKIAILRRQEKMAVFKIFNEETAFDLGSAVYAIAREQRAPVVVNIRTPNRALFHAALPGSTPDNDEWVRRKSNVVLRFHQSSMLFGQLLALNDRTITADSGLDLMDYAGHGGSFPIRMAQGGVIGAITVSGLPQVEDHRMIIAALNSFLKLELPHF